MENRYHQKPLIPNSVWLLNNEYCGADFRVMEAIYRRLSMPVRRNSTSAPSAVFRVVTDAFGLNARVAGDPAQALTADVFPTAATPSIASVDSQDRRVCARMWSCWAGFMRIRVRCCRALLLRHPAEYYPSLPPKYPLHTHAVRA